VLDDLASGAADLALGGLWVPGMYAGSPRELTVICQLNHQAPKAIVHRGAPESFEFSDLRGKVVLAPGIGGSAPYTVTAGLNRERTDRVEELRDRFTRFTACIDAAMTVLPTTSAETIDSILTARWPARTSASCARRHRADDGEHRLGDRGDRPAASDRRMRMIAEVAMVTRACFTEAGGFGLLLLVEEGVDVNRSSSPRAMSMSNLLRPMHP
jgi:hypothetical protein